MLPTVRVFFGHPKSWGDGQVDNFVEQITEQMKKLKPGAEISVVPGRDDFRAFAAAGGSYTAWEQSVANGFFSFNDRSQRFTSIVIPDRQVGLATKNILTFAKAAGKPCYLYESERFYPIAGVGTTSGEWTNGWRVLI